ncbi:MAG: hypothetical protein D6675_14615 [Gemmatimonadetes bacterium]|nr:MAG: hypothetical protein D6675_14615 [Gemmatimonadota bacterium]
MFIEVSEAQVINKREIIGKGKAILSRLENEIKNHEGDYIVIDVDSGDYAIEKDSVKAREKMQLRHPNKIFYAARLGFPAMYKFN